uniref:Uncharacterized protein n=1 Tax=Candidatus Nitrotoga fabula TaxID=2182327 RepID=A0A2X0RDQ2_9PROT|nr:protein of unknown function [Candidatus Nitrotoga fabula]
MTYANHDDVLEQIRSHGLILKDPLAVNTSRPIRVRVENSDNEKRGWYWLNDVIIAGSSYIVGAYGIYHGNDPGKQSVKLNRRDEKGQLKPLDTDPTLREALKARQAENQQRMKAMRAAEAERAAREAARVWKAYVPTGESDYLDRKGVAAHGVRFDPNGHGTLAIPMCDAYGNIHGLQIIRGKNRGKNLEKQYFPAGLAKQGHYHLIGGSPTWICLVAEGYATAASLHQATQLPVAVAFDAGNLTPVASALHKTYRRANLLICADDDHLTVGNPGITAASAASLAVSGAWIAPRFTIDRADSKITDFNDLHLLEGVHVVRRQIEARLRELKWQPADAASAASLPSNGSQKPDSKKPLLSLDEANTRYTLIYGSKGVLFDQERRMLVLKQDVLDICPDHAWREWKHRPDRRLVCMENVGFDPTESDPNILCNLWGGWPTEPREGKCTALLGLLQYLCSNESNHSEVYQWVLDWLAYPDKNRKGKVLRGSFGLWNVGTEYCKAFLYGALASDADRAPEDRALQFGQGLEVEYFDGLLSEVYDPEARRYVQKKGARFKRNEPLDTLVYAWAVGAHREVMIGRSRNGKPDPYYWERLRAMLEQWDSMADNPVSVAGQVGTNDPNKNSNRAPPRLNNKQAASSGGRISLSGLRRWV